MASLFTVAFVVWVLISLIFCIAIAFRAGKPRPSVAAQEKQERTAVKLAA